MTNSRFESLTMRYLGENLTLSRHQWEAMLEDLRPDSDAASRIRGLLSRNQRPVTTTAHFNPQLGTW